MNLNYEVSVDVPDAIFIQEIVTSGHRFCRTVRWETSARSIAEPDGWTRVLLQRGDSGAYALYRVGDCIVYLCLRGGELRVSAAGLESDVNRLCDHLREVYPVIEARDQEVDYRFWYCSPHGSGGSRRRTLPIPSWSSIADNYAQTTAASLAPLMSQDVAPTEGGVMLWHGEPGTGKTYALRALSWAWRRWCAFEYVLDPERFFSETRYMLDVLLDDDDVDEDRWRTLILEDTGELVAADARKEAGQGLSRLLNVADGLIGQGLRIQFLITTNEILDALHPAVLRPGRCSAQVEFRALPFMEASAWARRNGIDLPERRVYRLAELFALRDGKDVADDRPRLGFASY